MVDATIIKTNIKLMILTCLHDRSLIKYLGIIL